MPINDDININVCCLADGDYNSTTAWKNEWDVASMQNRVRTGHGRCTYLMHMWGIANSPACDCAHPTHQTMEHITQHSPLCKFGGSVEELYSASPAEAES